MFLWIILLISVWMDFSCAYPCHGLCRCEDRSNSISCKNLGLTSIPKSFAQLRDVRILDLQHNLIQTFEKEDLPEGLIKLNLRNNPVSCDIFIQDVHVETDCVEKITSQQPSEVVQLPGSTTSQGLSTTLKPSSPASSLKTTSIPHDVPVHSSSPSTDNSSLPVMLASFAMGIVIVIGVVMSVLMWLLYSGIRTFKRNRLNQTTRELLDFSDFDYNRRDVLSPTVRPRRLSLASDEDISFDVEAARLPPPPAHPRRLTRASTRDLERGEEPIAHRLRDRRSSTGQLPNSPS